MTVLSVQTKLFCPGAPLPVQAVWPCTVREAFPLGIANETGVVQSQVPLGMFTVVVEAVTALKAACTSLALQEFALIV
jgi:hypothetical protein